MDPVLGPVAALGRLEEEQNRLSVKEHSHTEKAAAKPVKLALDPRRARRGLRVNGLERKLEMGGEIFMPAEEVPVEREDSVQE